MVKPAILPFVVYLAIVVGLVAAQGSNTPPRLRDKAERHHIVSANNRYAGYLLEAMRGYRDRDITRDDYRDIIDQATRLYGIDKGYIRKDGAWRIGSVRRQDVRDDIMLYAPIGYFTMTNKGG